VALFCVILDLAVSVEHRLVTVTDGQTDTRRHLIPALASVAVVKTGQPSRRFIFSGCFLAVAFVFSTFSTPQSASCDIVVCQMMSKRTLATLGVVDESTLGTLDSFTRTFHVPFISTTTVPSLNVSTRLAGGYILFLRPSYDEALLSIVRYYNWTYMLYLYDSDAGKIHLPYSHYFHEIVSQVLPSMALRYVSFLGPNSITLSRSQIWSQTQT